MVVVVGARNPNKHQSLPGHLLDRAEVPVRARMTKMLKNNKRKRVVPRPRK